MKHLHPEQLIKDVMQEFSVSEREAKKAIDDTHGQPEELRTYFRQNKEQPSEVQDKETKLRRSDLTGKKVDGFPDTEEDKPVSR